MVMLSEKVPCPSMPMPSCWRTGLRTPSAATAYCARTVRSSPVTRSRTSAGTPSSSASTRPPPRVPQLAPEGRGVLAQHRLQPDLRHEDARRRAEVLDALVDVAEEPLQLPAAERFDGHDRAVLDELPFGGGEDLILDADHRNSSTVRCIRNAARGWIAVPGWRSTTRCGTPCWAEEQRRRQAHQAAADDQDRDLICLHATLLLRRAPQLKTTFRRPEEMARKRSCPWRASSPGRGVASRRSRRSRSPIRSAYSRGPPSMMRLRELGNGHSGRRGAVRATSLADPQRRSAAALPPGTPGSDRQLT